MVFRARSQFVLILTALMLTACSESTGPGTPPLLSVSSVELAAPTSNLVTDQILTVSATVKAADGTVLFREILWTSSDPAIATVTASGASTANVHAIKAGSVTITATAESHSGKLDFSVAPPPPPSIPLAFIWSQETGMIALAMLPGATTSDGNSINDLGQVAGNVRIGASDHAFVWTAVAGMVDIGGLPVAVASYAAAINNAGQVAGSSVDANGRTQAFRWSATEGIIAIPSLPGAQASWARGINAGGEVVGVAESATGQRAFHWSASRGTEDLGLIGTDGNAGANAINDNGDVVGFTSDGAYYESRRPVLWSSTGVKTVLAQCSSGFGCYSDATAINGSGMVAGTLQLPGNGQILAYRWTQTTGVQYLPTSDNISQAYAYGINEGGIVVGVITNQSFAHAVLWSPTGGTVDLGTLQGKASSRANGINKNGQVVGTSW